MSIEYVKQIKEKEEEAEKIRQDALSESTRIIKSANESVVELIEKTRAESIDLHREIIQKAEYEAQLDYEKLIHHVVWECDMLWESSKANLDIAVSLIKEEVMK